MGNKIKGGHSMEILPAIQQRRSVRAYTTQPVPEEHLQSVLEAARLAPSARNLQEWRFIVVRDSAIREQLAVAANGQAFVGQAPVVIVGCSVNTEYIMRGGQAAYPIDLAIALDHMTLQAVAIGLGTCWIGSFFEDEIRKILDIPAGVRVVCLLTLGYPADTPRPKNRRPAKEIIAYERWTFS
jgi:nitroreductase